MEGKVLVAKARTETGKNSNRRLRSKGIIPAVMYSHGQTEVIQIDEKDFFKLFKGHVSESVIFDLKVDGSNEEQMAFVKDYRRDPVSGNVEHIDFFQVTKGEKINTTVPIELDGTPRGLKMGGILNISDRQIEVECMPRNLPELVRYDISDMDVGDLVHASDLSLPEGVELLSNPESMIVSVDAPKVTSDESEEEEITAAEVETVDDSKEE